ncbi:MAG: hypothetical protein C0453_18085, partial [Comamonadaceae bacterium]|nr:hypothetical protein [Comamonadaceae bacterium]
CQWNNAAGLSHCFNCHALLGAEPGATAARPAPPADDPMGLAELGTRYVATLIDAMVTALAMAFVVLVYVFGLNGLPGAIGEHALMASLLALLAVLVLPGVLDAYGGSIGRRVMGIAVVRHNGERLNPVVGVCRHLLKYGFGLGMPFIGSLIARLLLGRRYLHEWFVRAQVVQSDALPVPAAEARRKPVDPNDFAAMLEVGLPGTPAAKPAQSPAKAGPSRWRRLKPVMLGAIALFFVLPLISTAWSIWADTNDPDKQLISAVKRSLQPQLDQLGLHAKAHGRYPDAWDALNASGDQPGGAALHPAVDGLHLDPDSGTVTVRLNAAPFDGQHLVFKPRPAQATVKVVRWDCGTTDIPVKRLPSDCAIEWPAPPTPYTPATSAP